MEQDMGAPASPSGCQPSASASISVESSRSAIPSAALACYDCGLPYASAHWIEAVVPHDIWNKYLSPTGGDGGILCINCMAKRAVDAGLSDVPVKLAAGPFVHA
jgi:hypothetical protein